MIKFNQQRKSEFKKWIKPMWICIKHWYKKLGIFIASKLKIWNEILPRYNSLFHYKTYSLEKSPGPLPSWRIWSWICNNRARFLSLARSKLRLCSANHRPGYFSNLACDWLSTAWAYSEQETENGPWLSKDCSLAPFALHIRGYMPWKRTVGHSE